MCKSIPGTQKHMTMDQRIMIEKGLDQSSSLRSIALQLPNIFFQHYKVHIFLLSSKYDICLLYKYQMQISCFSYLHS